MQVSRQLPSRHTWVSNARSYMRAFSSATALAARFQLSDLDQAQSLECAANAVESRECHWAFTSNGETALPLLAWRSDWTRLRMMK